jgi:hypothetical protein
MRRLKEKIDLSKARQGKLKECIQANQFAASRHPYHGLHV